MAIAFLIPALVSCLAVGNTSRAPTPQPAGETCMTMPTEATPACAAACKAAKAFVLNLTTGKEDLHKAWMGLALAEHALDDGRQVTVFLNVHAPALASKKEGAALKFGDKLPMDKMLEKLLGRGATVLVCPACMEAMGVAESDLIQGAQLADREKLFSRLGPNTAVFSY
jgi:predicted peroxiredoxin